MLKEVFHCWQNGSNYFTEPSVFHEVAVSLVFSLTGHTSAGKTADKPSNLQFGPKPQNVYILPVIKFKRQYLPCLWPTK